MLISSRSRLPRPSTPVSSSLACDESEDALAAPQAPQQSQLFVAQERAVLNEYANFLKNVLRYAQRGALRSCFGF